MKKFVLAVVAAAAAASFSGSALAVDLTAALPVPDNFASELVVANVTAVKGTTVITDLGFGVSTGQTRFIRYDFTNARFALPGIAAADLAIAAPGAAIVVSSGGAPSVGPQVGPVSVIFQITAAGNIAQDADVTLTLTSGLVPTDKQPIQATYRLFETAAAAVAGAPQLAQDSGTIIVFGSGVALTAVPATTTVNVASTPGTYTKFLTDLPATTPTLTRIGTVALGTGNAKTPDGNPVALSDFLGTGAAITLSGIDLLPAILPDGLSLQAGAVCAAGGGGGIIGTSRTASTARFVLPNPLPPGVIAGTLCFEVATANPLPIAAQVFTADVFPGVVPGLGQAPDIAEVTAGTFVRNGLVLKTAFAETNTTNANGYGTAIHLSNNSGSPAAFTVKCVLPIGSVAGLPGSVPAMSAQRFSLSRGLGCPSNGTLRGVEIIFEAAPGSVIGSVVRSNLTTGQSSFDGMVGNE